MNDRATSSWIDKYCNPHKEDEIPIQDNIDSQRCLIHSDSQIFICHESNDVVFSEIGINKELHKVQKIHRLIRHRRKNAKTVRKFNKKVLRVFKPAAVLLKED